MLKDFRAAIRLVRFNPLFAIVVALTIGLGIGLNTAMFSVAESLVLRPLSFPDLDRLLLVFQTEPGRKGESSNLSAGAFHDVAAQTQSVDKLATYRVAQHSVTEGPSPELAQGAQVSPDFFAILGTPALLGTAFTGSNQLRDSQQIVLGYDFWQTHFASDKHIVGRAIEVDGRAYIVAGVMPRAFLFPVGVEFWLAADANVAEQYGRTEHILGVIGKVKEGVSVGSVGQEFTLIAARIATEHKDTDAGWGLRVMSLRDYASGGMTGQYVLFLLGGVGFVLLIACSNVANLQLARGASRKKEMAIRAAIGASRWQSVRLLLVESVLLALLGSLVALPVAWISLDLIRINMPAAVARYVAGFSEIGLDPAALAFALAISIASGVLSGLMPAVWSTRLDLNDVLKIGGRSGEAGLQQRFRGSLLAGEVALAMTLLVGTGLMVRSVQNLSNVAPEGDPATVLTMRFDLSGSRYPSPNSREVFYRAVLEPLTATDALEPAAIATNIPYGGYGTARVVAREAAGLQRSADKQFARVESISANYLGVMRIPLREGRNFSFADGSGSRRVGLVSAAMARRYWPGRNVIGERLEIAGDKLGPVTVVGVTGDVQYNWTNPLSSSVLYLPYTQAPKLGAFLVVRTSNPKRVIRAVRAAVTNLDRNQPVSDIKAWDRVIAESTIGLSYVAVMMTLLGFLALSLAAVGLFGLVSYTARMQTTEIGVRIALGAQRADILKMIVGQGMVLTGLGVVVGSVAAAGLARMLSSLIVGANALDWRWYALAALLMVLAGLLASYLPARKAARIDPIAALRG